jgi:hypothetical protein
MQRSCLVGLILVAAVLMAASLALQRCLLPSEPHSAIDASPTAVQAPLEAPLALPEPTSPPPTPILVEHRLYEERIEGLHLEMVRPLADVEIEVRGLAARSDVLYVTAYDPNTRLAWLHEIDRASRGVLRSLPLDEPGRGEPCGLHLAGDILWTCISTDDAAQVLGIDRGAWSVSFRVPLHGSLRVVAQIDESCLMGVDRLGNKLYLWGSDLSLQRTATNGSGAVYTDCEVLRGSLLCAGMDNSGAVLDVIDPTSLSLLTRHRATTRTLWGAYVAGNGVAFDGNGFLLAPAGGEFPLVWSYRLDGIALPDYVPSTSPPR